MKNINQEGKIYDTVSLWLSPPDKVGGFYTDLKRDDREKIKTKNATKIFLLLSALYQFEIPAIREFVTDFLNIDEREESQIDILLRSKTISGDIEYLGLPHSIIAKLFTETANYKSNLKK